MRNPLKLRQISIHTLREEGDALYDEVGRFQSDFYPRPPRGGRLYSADGGFGVGRISIHALREEGDSTTSFSFHILSNFYPRPPRGGRRCSGSDSGCPPDFYPRPPRGGRQAGTSPPPNFSQFLSTPSARRATHKSRNPKGKVQFLSTPSARRATSSGPSETSPLEVFLSTPSARRATIHNSQSVGNLWISIHALREEGDGGHPLRYRGADHFYPRPPRGGRREADTAPLHRCYFYPRPPRGGRPIFRATGKVLGRFLSTPSARRATPAAP